VQRGGTSTPSTGSWGTQLGIAAVDLASGGQGG
jgi:hypothetical protein